MYKHGIEWHQQFFSLTLIFRKRTVDVRCAYITCRTNKVSLQICIWVLECWIVRFSVQQMVNSSVWKTELLTFNIHNLWWINVSYSALQLFVTMFHFLPFVNHSLYSLIPKALQKSSGNIVILPAWRWQFSLVLILKEIGYLFRKKNLSTIIFVIYYKVEEISTWNLLLFWWCKLSFV